MINLGHDGPSSTYYYNLLKSPHRVHIAVYLMDSLSRGVRNCSDMLMDGSVDIDASADVTRSAHLVLADPGYALSLDGPAVGGTGILNMMKWQFRIYYGVSHFDDPTAIWWCPIFQGPITDVSRDGIALDITCMGKEVMAMDGAFRAITFPPGWPKAYAQLQWLYGIGEPMVKHYSAKTQYVLQKAWALEAGTDVWSEMRGMMKSIGLQQYYDSEGFCCLRDTPYTPVFTFDETYITSDVDPVYDYDQVVNSIRVIGGTPEGWEGRFEYEASLPWYHPLSAVMMTRDGVHPRYLTGFVENDELTTEAEVSTAAWSALQDRTFSAMDVNFTSFVIPTLEEEDVYLINTRKFYGAMKFFKATIPLVGDAEMSVGFTSRSTALTRAGNGIGNFTAKAYNPKWFNGDRHKGVETGYGTGTKGHKPPPKPKPKPKPKKKNKNKKKKPPKIRNW